MRSVYLALSVGRVTQKLLFIFNKVSDCTVQSIPGMCSLSVTVLTCIFTPESNNFCASAKLNVLGVVFVSSPGTS